MALHAGASPPSGFSRELSLVTRRRASSGRLMRSAFLLSLFSSDFFGCFFDLVFLWLVISHSASLVPDSPILQSLPGGSPANGAQWEKTERSSTLLFSKSILLTVLVISLITPPRSRILTV